MASDSIVLFLVTFNEINVCVCKMLLDADHLTEKLFLYLELLPTNLSSNFSCFLSPDDFLKINFFKKFFQEYHQSVKQFGSRSKCRPDLELNCSQRLSADDTSYTPCVLITYKSMWGLLGQICCILPKVKDLFSSQC